jgi:2-iminoacetate synthase ThiH
VREAGREPFERDTFYNIINELTGPAPIA